MQLEGVVDTMKTEVVKRTCPLCGKEYTGYPALSRKDNATEICADCGTRESLEIMGVSESEIEKILDTIHQCVEKN